MFSYLFLNNLTMCKYVNNNISLIIKMGFIDKYFLLSTEKPCYIITYVDFNIILTKDLIIKYITDIYEKNTVLQNKICIENNLITSRKYKQYNINDHYEIKYIVNKYFDKYVKKLANNNSNNCGKSLLDWYFLFCVDEQNNMSRLIFKINHSKCDGEKLKKMLRCSKVLNTSSAKTEGAKTEGAKTEGAKTEGENTESANIGYKLFSSRKATFCDKIYYHVVGVIMLLKLNLKALAMLIFYFVKKLLNNIFDDNKNKTKEKKKKVDKIKFITCKSLPLHKIRAVAKMKNITINDLLYSILVRADSLYYQQKRNILTLSPISLNKVDTINNNFLPIVNIINNSYTKADLFQKVNFIFNSYKYSSYLFFFNKLAQCFSHFLNFDIFSIYNNSSTSFDYIFTNMIGPEVTNNDIDDIRFLVTPVNNEIIYNIISSKNKMNIVCSYSNNSINKKTFKKCIYEAYNELTTL